MTRMGSAQIPEIPPVPTTQSQLQRGFCAGCDDNWTMQGVRGSALLSPCFHLYPELIIAVTVVDRNRYIGHAQTRVEQRSYLSSTCPLSSIPRELVLRSACGRRDTQ
jgi:hypothetical protein